MKKSTPDAKHDARRVLVTLRNLEPAAKAAAAAAGLSVPAWIAGLVARELGKPAPEFKRGLANVGKKRRKAIAKSGAAAGGRGRGGDE